MSSYNHVFYYKKSIEKYSVNVIDKFIENKNKNYIIFDIGSRDCIQSIEFYKKFPNAKIYVIQIQ